MATSSPISALPALQNRAPIVCLPNQQLSPFTHRRSCSIISQPKKKEDSFRVQAAKLPPGVGLLCSFPSFEGPFLILRLQKRKSSILKFSGRIAKSRAQIRSSLSGVHKDSRNMELQSFYDWPCWDFHSGTGTVLILILSLTTLNGYRFMTELVFLQILNKGILQVIGVEVGKGLDLPL